MRATSFACALSAILVASPVFSGLPHGTPDSAGMEGAKLEAIDGAVADGLAKREMAGCVVCVGREGKIVYLKAFGDRQVEPNRVAMTTDTLFDMASVTKPVATATSIMLLVEQGRLRLRDRVAQHMPEFGQKGKEDITVEDLLLHQGGLIPDNSLKDYDNGPAKAWERICALSTRSAPGTDFVYSDVGFIVLGELVRRICGEDVHQFSQARIYGPLGMKETGYLPNEELRKKAAATEQRNGNWMQGEVHDPRAFLLGGIAGHAGLFSTAEDLAVYSQMMLEGGSYQGARIMSPNTIGTMTRSYRTTSGLRGLGWDKHSGYSSNRGELFSDRAFGHGGFTGTSLWIDPHLRLFVIFLSNRLHPDGKGNVNPLAGRVGAIAAGAIKDPPPAPVDAASVLVPGELNPARTDSRSSQPVGTALRDVLCGIDVLQRDGFRQLQGRRVGLITNQTGIDRQGVPTWKILHDSKALQLVAIFSPEHGIEGKLDQAKIDNATHPETGLPIFSLYGETRRPNAESLKNIDTLVFDIQDIGTRFYTYISTMGNAMQAAGENGVRFVVLDRPNPINGVDVAGPVLDGGRESFVAFHTLPVRHGMTIGELARMFKDEMKMQVELEVVPAAGWRRAEYFDRSGLPWVNPSPNMRSLAEAVLYPGIGLLETTNVSVGRGTDTPFEVIGAPWLDGRRLAAELNQAKLAGVCFVPIRFTPASSTHGGTPCGGINIIVTNRYSFEPLRTGLEIARQLRLLYPNDWKLQGYDRLLGNAETLKAIEESKSLDEIDAINQARLQEFLRRRAKFLIYD
jgi:uncharacterized protein YbbC (DUF1343 family)/CubicO group peptidase (beta-lactamase class C family)